MNKILVGKEIEGESYYTHDFVEMLSKQNTDLKQENKRLHSIIKEVREYLNKGISEKIYLSSDVYKLLEILDKESE